jgi:3'(2'), 5'-bisphosphate nucleotidase
LPEYFKDNESFELDDAIVWIDPLDGTLSYIKGEMDCVTTLIGVSVKGKPILGLIGKPYKKNGDGYDFSPMTYFAHANMNKIYYTYEKDIKSKVLIPYELDKP